MKRIILRALWWLLSGDSLMTAIVLCRNMMEICQRPINIFCSCKVGYTNTFYMNWELLCYHCWNKMIFTQKLWRDAFFIVGLLSLNLRHAQPHCLTVIFDRWKNLKMELPGPSRKVRNKWCHSPKASILHSYHCEDIRTQASWYYYNGEFE